MRIERFLDAPVITSGLHPSIGDNINGPCIIKVPGWIQEPLGKYYMYFSHHRGTHIRLAYADSIAGPWKIYEPGVLHVEQTPDIVEHEFRGGIGHIASPEAFVIPERKLIVMTYHGTLRGCQLPNQMTWLALSNDGIHFVCLPDIIGDMTYWRIWKYKDCYYSIQMYGVIHRSRDGIHWQAGPRIFQSSYDVRHTAVKCEEDKNLLHIWFSIRGTENESIEYTTMDLSGDWMEWKQDDNYRRVLTAEEDYEGADLPITVSKMGPEVNVHELRDPSYFRDDDGQEYLFYTVKGEEAIAMAKIYWE